MSYKIFKKNLYFRLSESILLWPYHVLEEQNDSIHNKYRNHFPCPIGQSVADLIDDPGVVSWISAWPGSFVEIDHEIYSTVTLFLPLIQEVPLSFTRVRLDLEKSLNLTLVLENSWNLKKEKKNGGKKTKGCALTTG